MSNFTGTTKSPGAIQKEQMENNSTNIAELHDDFSEQYHRWVQPVFRYLRSCINNHADAEDLTAQTFHALFENKSRYLRAENFKALLFKIARNKLIDQLRKEKAVQLLPLADWITLEDAKSDWSIDQRIALKTIIQNLPLHQQELLRLRYIAGLDHKTIAKVLDKSPAAVRKAIYRLTLQLKQQIGNKNA